MQHVRYWHKFKCWNLFGCHLLCLLKIPSLNWNVTSIWACVIDLSTGSPKRPNHNFTSSYIQRWLFWVWDLWPISNSLPSFMLSKKKKKKWFASITLTIFNVDPTGGIQEFLTTQHGTSISIIGMPFTWLHEVKVNPLVFSWLPKRRKEKVV